MGTSSAVPADLDDYARASDDADDDLQRCLADLRAALDDLRASRPDHLGVVPALDRDVDDLLRRGRSLALLARDTAAAFLAADERDRDRSPFDLMDSIVTGTRSAWTHAVHVDRCNPFPPGASYGGGGFLIGPDGRRYPLVIPRVVVGGRPVTAGPAHAPDTGPALDLGGADPGWVVVAERTGVARTHPEESLPAKILIGIAGMNANVAPTARAATRRELQSLAVETLGRPSASAPSPTVSPGPPTAPPSLSDVEPLEAEPAPRPTPPARTVRPATTPPRTPPVGRRHRVARRGATGLTGADLAGQVASGAALVQNVDNSGLDAYRVVFEENVDGRRRARLRLDQEVEGPDGKRVTTSHGHVHDGRIERTPVQYAAPPTVLTIGPAGS